MNPFPDVLQIEDYGMRGESRVFRLTARFRYLSSLGCITVPQYSLTDGASIPRAFWSILYPFGKWFPAAVIHDFLYSPGNTEFTRDEADFIFLEAMYNVGVPWHKRHTIHAAVRLFGGRSFKAKLRTI
jgi:hypothetical protein